EGPDPDDVARELHVAGHAARAGAPVVPPTDGLDPGPHGYGGHVVAFWRYVPAHGKVDPGAAGRGLRAIHESLADYDGALPRAGHAESVRSMLASVERSADVELLEQLAALQPIGQAQALHGDAHLGNCMASAGGPLWHDFETAVRGPREYDLAA